MTLLDWFAGQALTGLLSQMGAAASIQGNLARGPYSDDRARDLAAKAYQLAGMMLQVRAELADPEANPQEELADAEPVEGVSE